MEPNDNDTHPIRVLIVEDEWLIGTWIAESLSEQGFAVDTVSNAADALRHLAANAVDVLFTDVNLPGGMDGLMLARRARELRPHLSVLYASARSNAVDPEAQVPGSIFVPKPYVPALVARLLAHATAKSAVQPLPA